MYNIFFGTMYCGETNFSNCKKMINMQKGINFEHYIIENLGEKEAHENLFSKWNEVKNNFDLFIKVDADTVLISDTIAKEIADLMYSENDITGMQCKIKDYFTDDLIAGLNAFKPSVIFKTSSDKLYCDRVDTNHKKVIKGSNMPKGFEPAAYHCYHSSKKQAFHYGLHRMLKNQTDVILKVKNAWNKNKDDIRLYALAGAIEAVNFKDNTNFDYNDKKFIQYFQSVEKNIDEYRKRLEQ